MDLGALAVESFDTAGFGHVGGTVRGNMDPEATFQTLCVTDVGQCETWACGPETDYSCGTCAAMKTCGVISCVVTACAVTCAGECDPYYSVARCAATDVNCP